MVFDPCFPGFLPVIRRLFMLFIVHGNPFPEGHNVDDLFYKLFFDKNIISQHTYESKIIQVFFVFKGTPALPVVPVNLIQEIPLHPFRLFKNFRVYIFQTASAAVVF